MMLCCCSKRNVTKLVFFVFSFLQPVVVGPFCFCVQVCWQAVSFICICSTCCLLQRKDAIAAGFLWSGSVWERETLTFLLPREVEPWWWLPHGTALVKWKCFLFSSITNLSPELYVELVVRPRFSLLQHTLPLLLQFTQGTVFPQSKLRANSQEHNLKSHASPWLLALLSNWLARLFCVTGNRGGKSFNLLWKRIT